MLIENKAQMKTYVKTLTCEPKFLHLHTLL